MTVLALVFIASTQDAMLERAHRALNEWQLAPARAISEELIRKAPRDGEVLALASRVQFYRGEYSSASSLYAAAIEAGAETDPFYANLVLATEKLVRNNNEKESEHFRISFPPGKDALFADFALPVLEASYVRIAQDLGLEPDPTDKIAVLVVPDAEGLATVSTLLPMEIERSGTIAICKFNRLMVTSPLATFHGYDWADTLAHEYTHLVINLVARNRVPIWLHEGIAKFVETRWNGEAGRSLSPGSTNLLARAAKDNKFIPFERMHPSMAKLPSQEESGLAFAEVFVAISMLQEKRGMAALSDVLSRIGKGADVEDAVSGVYGKPFSAFLNDWRERLRGFKGKTLVGAQLDKIALKKAGQKETDLSELEPIAEKKVQDFQRLADLLDMRGHRKAAAIEYERAYVVAGPRYPQLLSKYAAALVANGDDNKAETVLKELLVPHPHFSSAHLMLGRLALKRGDKNAASEHYMDALYQNPFNPEIHEALLTLGGDASVQRHLTWAKGQDLPGPKAPPAGDARLTVIAAPFGRLRLPDGTMTGYPAVGVAVKAPVRDVELVSRDGKSKTVQAQEVGAARYEIVQKGDE